MILKSISIANFRNLENVHLDANENINILFGENGQGKTNLLESIYLLSGSKSFRGSKEIDLIRKNSDFYKINGDFVSNKENNISVAYSKKGKEIYFNEIKKPSANSIVGEFLAIVFSPTDLSLIKNGPDERRQFLNSSISQIKPYFSTLLNEYKKVLLQKNACLKDYYKDNSLYDIIDVYNQQLAKIGTLIHCTRVKFLNELQFYTKDLYQGISNNKEILDFKYSSSVFEENKEVEYTDFYINIYYEKLKSVFQNDLHYKYTTVGVNKDDVLFYINDLECKNFGSQGQQRSVVIVLKLALAKLYTKLKNDKPVILLDDVMSELDKTRMNFILNHLTDMQVFITCCDYSNFSEINQNYNVFQIANGGILNIS